jgi:hypothetical protein
LDSFKKALLKWKCKVYAKDPSTGKAKDGKELSFIERSRSSTWLSFLFFFQLSWDTMLMEPCFFTVYEMFRNAAKEGGTPQ